MRKFLALVSALAVVLLLSVGPVAAQTYPVAIDRNGVTITYWPTGGTSAFDVGVSYRFNPQWDALVGYRSGPAAGTSLFTLGGRYHLQPPASGFDVYGTLQYASPSGGGASYLMVGGGLVQPLAPGLKSAWILDYAFLPAGAVIVPKMVVQYELSRQFSFVAGVDLATGTTGTGYIGVNIDFSTR
jgi:hypothetical protein